MRKKITKILGISVILLMLLTPNASALPQIYLNSGDAVVHFRFIGHNSN